MEIDNLVIEVTRKCNMTCDHCLRGHAQNIDIIPETIKKFLIDNEISYISMIIFTGGEPSLNVNAIRQFMKICKLHNIDVGSFYIATNGKEVANEFILVCLELYLFCQCDEISQVEVSNSMWHNSQEKDTDGIEKLKCLKFANEKYEVGYNNLINEGRAKDLHINNPKEITPEPLIITEEGRIEEIDLYLNVFGDIITSCDLSYERQEKEKIGNIYNSTLKKMVKKQGGTKT